MRSGIVRPLARIGADAAVLVTGEARVMSKRVRTYGGAQGRGEQGVGRFQKNRAEVDAAIGDESRMSAQEQTWVKAVHHFASDALRVAVAAATLDLGPQAQRWQHFEPWPGVTDRPQHRDKTTEHFALIRIVVH